MPESTASRLQCTDGDSERRDEDGLLYGDGRFNGDENGRLYEDENGRFYGNRPPYSHHRRAEA